MPHEIDLTTGQAAFIYNKLAGDPWHKLGVPVDGAMTSDDLFRLCPALDFLVDKRPLYTEFAGGHPQVPGYQSVVRLDTGGVLGVVTDGYSLYQNHELAAFGDALFDSAEAKWDTAGSLYEGRKVFMQMELGDEYKIEGDPSPYQRRLLLFTGHDGATAAAAKRVQTRVVCANTFGGALREAGGSVSIRHSSGMMVRMEDARRALRIALRYDEAFQDVMAGLFKVELSRADVVPFTKELIPDAMDPDARQRTGKTRQEDARDAIASLYQSSPTLEGVREGGYRMFQAVTEYADWKRPGRTDTVAGLTTKAMSTLDGPVADLKQRALQLLIPSAVGRGN